MPRDYKNIKNNKSKPKIKNTSNLFSFLIGLVLGTFATSIYFNQNENIYKGKPSFNDNNYNKENENIETINTKEIIFDFPTILEERTVEEITKKTYPETQINLDKSENITRYIIQVGSFKNFKSLKVAECLREISPTTLGTKTGSPLLSSASPGGSISIPLRDVAK
jgi:hypothetical protein